MTVLRNSRSVWCLQHTDERYKSKISINAIRSIYRQMYKYAIGKYMAVSMAIIPSSMRDLQIIRGQSSVPGGVSIVMRTEINGHPDCRLLMVNKLSSIIPTAQYLVITIIILGTYSEDRSDFFSHIHVRLVQVSRNSRWKLANSNKTERQKFYKLIWVMTDERISKILMHSYDTFLYCWRQVYILPI